MKYIEKKYQQLIQDIESAYDDTCDTLKYHINELKKMLSEKDEEIEKLKGGSQLQKEIDEFQKEIDEYNRLEAQNNMNLEDEIVELKAKLAEKESDLKGAYDSIEAWENRFYTLVKAYGIDLNGQGGPTFSDINFKEEDGYNINF